MPVEQSISIRHATDTERSRDSGGPLWRPDERGLVEAEDHPQTEAQPSEEGWFVDPFGLHEARWLSEGKPTKLVGDGEVETYDDPPNEDTVQGATRIQGTPAAGGADLRRADEGAGDISDLEERMGDAALEGGAHPMIDLP